MQIHSPRSPRVILATATVVILTIFILSGHHFQSLDSDTRSESDTLGKDEKLGDLIESGPRVRQATVALQNEYNPVSERAIKSHVRHGDVWGYPTHILRHSMLAGNSGYSQFNKLSFIQMLLLNEMAKPYGQRAGWIVSVTPLSSTERLSIEDTLLGGTNACCNSWFDADTVLLNPKVPWTAFLPPTKFPNIHYLATRDWNGFNAGVFLIRVHEWSVKMLADAQALPSLRPDITFSFEDQGAMYESFSRPEFRDSVVFQPRQWWNEYLELNNDRSVHPGDLLIHFAGLGGKDGFMGPWLDRIEHTASKWAVPLENTSYLGEIKKYWDTYGRATEVLERVNNELSPDTTNRSAYSMKPIKEASEKLRERLWKEADDCDSIQKETESLADYLAIDGNET